MATTTKSAARELGACEFISKPVDVHDKPITANSRAGEWHCRGSVADRLYTALTRAKGGRGFMLRFHARRDLLRVLPLALISTLMPRVGISAAEAQADGRVRNEGSNDVPAELTHRMISINGIRMHVAERGEGPLVLLCHGWPDCWCSWRL